MTRLLAMLAIAGMLTSRAGAEDPDALNTGEDETRPLTRIDLKYQYQNLAGPDNDDAHIITLRMDKPFRLARDWQLATRIDLPLYITDAIGSDNPDGDTHVGLGDMLVQALVVHSPTASRFGWVAGTRLVLPTASEDRMGSGKWRAVSTAGFRWFLPEMSEGSWIGFQARYDVDFAGDPGRRHVSELQLGPQLYVQLPRTWFLNVYPATDIRHNFSEPLTPYDTGRWFVPLDLAAGKMLSKNRVVSLEIGVPIVKQYVFYDFKIEARIGFFF